MKNLRKMLLVIFGSMFLLMVCTACSSKEKSTTLELNSNQAIQNEDEITSQSDIQDESSKKQENVEPQNDEANLEGSVVEFSDNGFTLSAATVTTDKDGGEEMVGAAPGSEDVNDLITISYSENTIFEIETLDAANLAVVSRETTEKQSVKKQSSVKIYGSCQDTYHWTADKVTIIQWKK